jgi:uncharacterized cofD-like protein
MYKNAKIVAIGGGTGLSTLLRGLKNYCKNITAVVNVSDNGGSSGKLRENMDIMPPGDFRNCLLALANTDPSLEKVFQYRFTAGEGLEGHSLGNLFLAAMTESLGIEGALATASKVLAVKGNVLPVTLDKLTLAALFTDGSEVYGECQISSARKKIARLRLEPQSSQLYPMVKPALLEADVIAVGPGSLYTSILANLLVPGLVESLMESKAEKIYICNVMTQPGETDGFAASDHLKVIYDHVGERLFDAVIVNTNMTVPQALSSKYAAENQFPVFCDCKKLIELGVKIKSADLLYPQEMVRHDADRLARLLLTD